MSNTQLNSLVLGRAAGSSFGVKDGDLGRLSLIAYTMGNPLLAIAAARSMARSDGYPPDGCDDKDALVVEIATDDAEAARDAAVKAEKAAESARQLAEVAAVNAKNAADAAAKAATTAQLAATDAQKAAADAREAAKTGEATKASIPVLAATKK